jgi:Mrp family chromosome partitioning ATPase
MVVSDSLALASSTGADVVMVVQARGTRRAAAIKAKEQFTQIGTDIKGVIVNAIDPRDESGYYYTEYTYYSDERQPKRGLARLFSRRSAVTP